MQDKYLSHSANQNGTTEFLIEHLKKVASRAARSATFFEASEEAQTAGLLHDLGKYGDLFQKRLLKEESGIDHWSAGAWVALTALQQEGIAAALAIQGHHIGIQRAEKDSLAILNPMKLKDQHPLNLKLSEPDVNTLIGRLKKDGIDLSKIPKFTSLYRGIQEPPASGMLDVRMLYSALVDADFIETEEHFKCTDEEHILYRHEGFHLNSKKLLNILVRHINNLSAKSMAASLINSVRNDLLQSCLKAAEHEQGLFTMTAPTGSGKTLSMLAFALKHAIKNHLRRIILVIPYLSIIEQTAQVYKDLFKAALSPINIDQYILEHHSLADIYLSKDIEKKYGEDTENEDYKTIRLLTENWDAPIVITTNVQFFESLFSNRPSACRKLHNLAKSVILFDEVQTFSPSLIVPTLATLSRLTERYRSTVVFSTATQPAFMDLGEPVKRFCAKGWEPKEIVSEQNCLFQKTKRNLVEWPTPQNIDQPISWSELAGRLVKYDQVLCIVNIKRHAYSLLDELEKIGIGDDLYHLSTNMCPAHRVVVLQDIRKRLRDGLRCILISTQCVEAGVDLDFPAVYRAMGPLEAIAQAAGRCNRNGNLESGNVVIFASEESYPDFAYRQATSITKMLYRSLGSDGMDIDNPELFNIYYREVYNIAKPENQNKILQEAILRQDFVQTAANYRLIPKATVNVLVPYDHTVYDYLASEVRQSRLTKRWMARASAHAIGIYQPRKEDPVARWLEPVPVGRRETSQDWYIYLNKDHYDNRRGLIPPVSMECMIA